MNQPEVLHPTASARFTSEKMGKSTLFQSERMLVGLNAFEPGQEHGLHAHAGQDKLYHTIEGRGLFLLEDRELEMEAGQMMVAPQGVPHGIRNISDGRLIVLVVMAPAPSR